MVQRKIKISDEEILEIFKTNITLHQAAVKLNMTNVSLWRRAKKLGLKWSEKKNHPGNTKIPTIDILEGKYPEYQTFKLKHRLLEEGYKQNKCEICGISNWNGKPLSMQLDHKDGNPHNHKLENLKMLCPNCHSQTETFCGKNKVL